MYNPSGFKLYGFASITSIDIIFYTVCVYIFVLYACCWEDWYFLVSWYLTINILKCWALIYSTVIQ